MELVDYNNSKSEDSDNKLPPLNSQPKSIGGRYTIASSAIAHNLPPRNAIRNDNHSGVIDSWPAHSANQRPSNIQLALAKNNTLIISNSIAEGKPDLTPKPKFLENLEKFLQHELKKLSTSSANNSISSEAKLQAYREAFEYLLEEFKTYRPILTAIKNEYELMLAQQREKIRELEPLKQMLVTLADQCDHKLMQYREEEKLEIVRLKEEKKKLIELVGQLKNDRVALQTQVDKLHNELLSEHEKFRNEQDKRKLLILDLNDLRFQQEEAKLAEMKREKKRNAAAAAAIASGEAPPEDNMQDDPVTLKIALRVCRQNLTDAMKRLTKMEADYNDVIPRRDHEKLESKYKESLEINKNLEKELKQMKHEQITLRELHRQVDTKYQDLQQELEDLREVNTPRPEWERVGGVLDGEKWKEMCVNKSSVQLLDLFIHELQNTNKKEFAGLGTSQDIPVYLRFDGRAKNRNMSRKEVSSIVNEIIKERIAYKDAKEASKEDIEEFPEFFINYLKKKYSTEAYDYSYSLHDGFVRYSQENIQYFQNILTGEADENIVEFERKTINQFRDQLKEKDPKYVTKNTLRELLKSYFKYKDSDQIEMLIRMAEDDTASTEPTKIEYNLMFDEDSEEKQFLNVFKSFLKEDRLSLANKIREAIGSSSSISSADLKKAISQVDESIVEKNVDKVINFVFSSQLDKTIDSELLKKRLDKCCLYNYAKKN